jgi:hypothetical protein
LTELAAFYGELNPVFYCDNSGRRGKEKGR